MKMLEWQVGVQTDFSVSVGKRGKYLEKYLSEQSWQELLSTYATGSYEDTWRALLATGHLFRVTAEFVAERLNYEYPYEEDERVTAYLKHIKDLPAKAHEIY